MNKVYIKDQQDNKVLPYTHVSAVLDDEGNDLSSHLGAFEDEVRGLVETPHQEYVTVATYASLPASGSADTIYRVSSYDGANSQVDDTVYSEYAWDGAQYVFLCVKSQIDEVFDITVYNSNTKYANLSAALGVDGANIPQSLRRGGMSVKYVQSSDNKYIQARCMAQNFTTDVTQWQGVDDKPTDGSKNLVESGGVFEKTNISKSELLTVSSTLSDKYISSSGYASDGGGFAIVVYQVVQGEKLSIYNNYHEGVSLAYCFYNSSTFSSSNVVQKGPNVTAQENNYYNVIVPEGATYLGVQKRVNVSSASVTRYDSISASDMLKDINAKHLYFIYKANTKTIKVNRKYSALKDIQVELAPCGPNNLVAIKRWGFVNNENTKTLSQNSPSTFINADTDWIEPYVMWCTDSSVSGSGSGGWTGGWHGDTTYPTAETISVEVYKDGCLCSDDSVDFANEVKIVVTNRVKAGNKISTQDVTGTNCLEEKVVYSFKGKKIYVNVSIKALYDIRIDTYYGMAVSKFGSEISFFGKDIQTAAYNGTLKYNSPCNCFASKNTSGEYIIAIMDAVGIGTGREHSFYAHAYAAYSKAYFNLINTESPLTLAQGESTYWSGSYEFAEKLELTSIGVTPSCIEGVDNIPTNNSNNVVKSGGVKNAIDEIAGGEKIIKDALNIRETSLTSFGSSYSGYITQDGNLVSASNAFITHYYVKSGYGLKVTCSQDDAPVTQSIAWAIYNSTTVFDETTLLSKSDNNAKGTFTESFVVPDGAKTILVQRFYVGSSLIKQLTNLGTDALDEIDGMNIALSKKKRSFVYLQDAIVNTSLTDEIKDKVLDGILSLKVDGISGGQYIISKVSIVNYSGYYLTIDVSEIVDGSLVKVCTFEKTNASMAGITKITGRVEATVTDVYYAECIVDLEKLGTSYFTSYNVTSVNGSTYRNYGINPECFVNPVYKSVLPESSYNRLRRAFRALYIEDLDNTRSYLLKTFSYNTETGYLSIEVCTTENYIAAYSFNLDIGTEHSGIEKVKLSDDCYAELDFSVLKSNFRYSYTSSTLPKESLFSVDINGGSTSLLAEDELTLTLDGEPMKLHDCGVVSKLFYLSCGNDVYSTKSITKQNYTSNDIDNTLIKVCSFPEERISTTEREYIEGVNALKELNNGSLIINVRVCYYTTDERTEHGEYSIFYRYDGSTLHKLFAGNWNYLTLTSGVVKNGGRWTAVWDYDNYNNLVFLSERCNQGVGGRAWMSKDGGITWYVIFNAFTNTNYNLYKVVQPSGWDSEHNDFERPVPGTGSYPNSNFHIHGIAYDRWRDCVYIVSGDASMVKGSYTAVWILNNPGSCSLYPASGDIPEGATNGSIKMLECNWTRIGLYSDENNLGKNLQFVSILPFKNKICFGTDSGGGGINGIISNTYPDNFVATNFKVEYPLNADSENALTHCAGGVLKLDNTPFLWTFHREGSGFGPTSSDQKGCVIAINYKANTFNRVWLDDTLNSDRATKVSWGSTMIGNGNELYLRYKGWGTPVNIIRRMRLK